VLLEAPRKISFRDKFALLAAESNFGQSPILRKVCQFTEIGFCVKIIKFLSRCAIFARTSLIWSFPF